MSRLASTIVVALLACTPAPEPDVPPRADAGPDQRIIQLGAAVTLDGSKSSDPKGAALVFMWEPLAVPAGSTAALSDPSAEQPQFVADLPGFYVFALRVRSGQEESAPDVTTVQALDPAYDHDGDGISTGAELAHGTDPMDQDTDDDGLSDWAEDANANGVVDAGETDPNNRDTDGDGLQDGTELRVNVGVADPDGAGPLLGTNKSVFIPDSDPPTGTDPLDPDSDDDCVPDGGDMFNGEDKNLNGLFERNGTDRIPGSADDESDPNNLDDPIPGGKC